MPYQVRNVSRTPHTRGLRVRAIGLVKRTLWVGARRVAPGRSITISDEDFPKLFQLLRTNAARGACEVYRLNEEGGAVEKVDFQAPEWQIQTGVVSTEVEEPEAPEEGEEGEAQVDEEVGDEDEGEDEPAEEVGDEESRAATVAQEALSEEPEEELTHAASVEADPGKQDPEANKEAAPEPEAKAYTKAELMSLRKDDLHEVFKERVGDQNPVPTKNEMANAILSRQP